jgi:hypothetical protein
VGGYVASCYVKILLTTTICCGKMSSSDIDLVHKAVGYTDSDAAALRQVRAVWKKLEAMRSKASKGEPRALTAYREFLEKSIIAARQVQALPDATRATSEFWAWYIGECERLGVTVLERDRGLCHAAWSEKWLKTEYAAFEKAYGRFVETATPQGLNDIKGTATRLLQAYVEAFKNN